MDFYRHYKRQSIFACLERLFYRSESLWMLGKKSIKFYIFNLTPFDFLEFMPKIKKNSRKADFDHFIFDKNIQILAN